jgi:hypothetical protein
VARFILGVHAAVFFAMLQLITILNRCHHFQGFVYQQASFSSDHKSIEIAVRPRKGSAAVCSRCHQPAPGYDQLAERRYDFIPLGVSGLPAVRRAARRLPPLRSCVGRGSSLGQRQASIDQCLHAVSGPLGAVGFRGKKPPRRSGEWSNLPICQTTDSSVWTGHTEATAISNRITVCNSWSSHDSVAPAWTRER